MKNVKFLNALIVFVGLLIPFIGTSQKRGFSFEEALATAKATNGSTINVTVATNQSNGIVSYYTGGFKYFATVKNRILFDEYLTGTLECYFSDRILRLPEGTFGISQPFSVKSKDQIKLSIHTRGGDGTAALGKFTLLSWGNGKFDIELTKIGDLLYGRGAPVGNFTNEALYSVSFNGVIIPPR